MPFDSTPLQASTTTNGDTTELRPNLWQAGWARLGTKLTSMVITQDVTASLSLEE
tara:strand:+ start:1962 stop:2126 length:165 start_codon:yes stop_codon:yes gene_type:complete